MSLTGAGLNSMRSIPTFGTVGAIAEIIDNSIQWKTDKNVIISVIFIERNNSLDEILICDNGQGMGMDKSGKEVIDYCLYFGGGTNHNATSNLGKYGIGLPFACCSQSKDYHVYSWQEKNKIKHVYRNHNEIGLDDIVHDEPHSIVEKLPKHFIQIMPELAAYNSGTIIQWKECDRATYKKSKTLINHIEKLLGRIYRYYIGNGVEINFLVYSHSKNSTPIKVEDLCRPIKKLDPLFLDQGTALDTPYDMEPTSELWCDNPISFKDSNGIEHFFNIKASLAKEEIQKPNGKDGGRYPIGKEYKKVQGISLVRANRELKLDDFKFEFPNGQSDPVHRWWKIEVKFEPKSDELMGVNANKTDALNFRFITDEDADEDSADYIKLRHQLAAKVQNLIKELYAEVKKRGEGGRKGNPKAQQCPACHQNTLIKGKCENCGHTTDICPLHSFSPAHLCPMCAKDVDTSKDVCPTHKVHYDANGLCPKCKKTEDLTEEETNEIITILKTYSEYDKDDETSIKTLLNWFVKCGKKHFVLYVSDRDEDQFINIADFQKKFELILVNKNHPYYIQNIKPLRDAMDEGGDDYDAAESALESIVLFFITWVETEKGTTSDADTIKRFRKRFGMNLSEILNTWKSTT